MEVYICNWNLFFTAYEYMPDSEIGIMTGPSGSEEDLLAEKVINLTKGILFINYFKTY